MVYIPHYLQIPYCLQILESAECSNFGVLSVRMDKYLDSKRWLDMRRWRGRGLGERDESFFLPAWNLENSRILMQTGTQ